MLLYICACDENYLIKQEGYNKLKAGVLVQCMHVLKFRISTAHSEPGASKTSNINPLAIQC